MSCGDVTRLTEQKFPAKPKDYPIEVFYNTPPTKPFQEIAILKEASEWHTAGEKLLGALKVQARKVGADAIILRNVGTQTTTGSTTITTNPTTGFATANTYQGVVGVADGIAIRWTESSSTYQPAPTVRNVAATPTGPTGPSWALAVNTIPAGAIVSSYDDNQRLKEIGRAPFTTVWSARSKSDSLVVSYQAQTVTIIPLENHSITIDFNSIPPTVTGGRVLESGR